MTQDRAAGCASLARDRRASQHPASDYTLNSEAGFKTAAADELPETVAVLDPFHVALLAGKALECRCRGQHKVAA